LPAIMWVEAKNKQRSCWVNCMSRPLQALSWSVLLSHNQRRRSASPALSRSWTPRPPSEIGRLTVRQLTWQCPPLASALPSQRNPRCIFSSILMMHFGGCRTRIWCRGIAARAALTSRSRPDQSMSLDFQVGSLAAVLATSRC
jgi:hypothetical protein